MGIPVHLRTQENFKAISKAFREVTWCNAKAGVITGGLLYLFNNCLLGFILFLSPVGFLYLFSMGFPVKAADDITQWDNVFFMLTQLSYFFSHWFMVVPKDHLAWGRDFALLCLLMFSPAVCLLIKSTIYKNRFGLLFLPNKIYQAIEQKLNQEQKVLLACMASSNSKHSGWSYYYFEMGNFMQLHETKWQQIDKKEFKDNNKMAFKALDEKRKLKKNLVLTQTKKPHVL